MVIYGNLVITIYNIKTNIEYFKKFLAQPPQRLFLSEKYVEFSKIIEICVSEKKNLPPHHPLHGFQYFWVVSPRPKYVIKLKKYMF